MAGDSFDARKATLSPLEYQVVVNKGTERPFSNKYNRHFETGSYHCILCSQELFKSESKFESKSGWPAFSNVVHTDRVKLKADTSHVGMNFLLLASRPDLVRTEVMCSICGAHLGHLFKDGPRPTGLRYCINSSSLSFTPTDGGGTSVSIITSVGSSNSNEHTMLSMSKNSCSSSDKICFFAPENEKRVDRGFQRISTTPRPLPGLRETTL